MHFRTQEGRIIPKCSFLAHTDRTVQYPEGQTFMIEQSALGAYAILLPLVFTLSVEHKQSTVDI